MTTVEPKATPSRPLTPLWVISLFVSLTEAVLSLAVTQTTGGIQVTLTIFVVTFPVFVAAAFFAVLWFRPHHFYAPTEYGQQMSAREYIEAMTQRKPLDENQLYTNIQKTIRSTLASDEIIAQLTEAVSRKADKQPEEEIAQILDSAVDKAVETIREEGFLTIDLKPLVGAHAKTLLIPYDRFTTVAALLDDTWFSLGNIGIPPFKYGKRWALRDTKSKHIFRDLGNEWAAKRGLERDNRRLDEAGILPGMKLDVIPLIEPPY